MLSIILVNYKNSRDIQLCLSSIIKHEPRHGEYEFIIVDNDSADQYLPDLQTRFPSIKIIYAPMNGGFAYGNNIGIQAATHDVILLLNPDTYVEDNSIEKLYDRLANDPDIDLIGPILLYPDGKNQSYYLPKSYLTLWKLFCVEFFLYKLFPKIKLFNSYFRTNMDYDKELEVEQLSGAALMFKKSILEKTGLMDDNYFMYYEESDFCYQAVKNGCHLLFYPQSSIIHVGGFSNDSPWHRKIALRSFKYYFKKNFNFITALFAIILFTTGESLKRTGIFRKIKDVRG